MSDMNILNESVRLYKDRKDKCIKFVKKIENLAQEYETDFPPVEDKSKNFCKSEVFHAILEKLQNEKLKILVAGQFKNGKSTLINALLGEEVLPAYSTPCTAVITEITYGEQKKAIISFKKQIMSVPENLSEKAKRHIGRCRENIPDLIIESNNLGSELEEYLVIPEVENKEQKESVAESPYSCCRLSWPLELCRNEVEIIDSPGLNEATARDETTIKYVPQADIVLLVMTALQLFGKPDREFLDRLKALGAPTVLFLVNRFDQLNSEKEKDRIRERALRELQNYTTYGNNGIFFISSWLALNARMENDEKLYSNSGFRDFEGQISHIIEKDRIKMKLGVTISGACSELDAMANRTIPDLRKKLDASLDELEKKFKAKQKDFAKLEDRKKKIQHTIEREMNNIRKMYYNELRIFFRDFSANSVVESIADTSINIEIFNKEGSSRVAARKLTEDILDALYNDLEDFNNNKSEDIKERISDLGESINYQFEGFSEIIDEIRNDMDMDEIDHNLDFEDLNMNDIKTNMSMIGSAYIINMQPLFLTDLFEIIQMIFKYLFGNTSLEDEFKDKFAHETARKIRLESDTWAKEISEMLAEKLNELKDKLIDTLENRINETKYPIEEAINNLKNNQGNIDEKKRQLDSWHKKFLAALEEGKELQKSI